MKTCTHGYIVGSCKACAHPADAAAFGLRRVRVLQDKMRSLPSHVDDDDADQLEAEALERMVKDREEYASRIQALEAERDDLRNLFKAEVAEVQALTAERDALRADAVVMSKMLADEKQTTDALRAEVERLKEISGAAFKSFQGENARLREALDEALQFIIDEGESVQAERIRAKAEGK